MLTFFGDKRRQGGGLSLTIQYKAVTRVDVTPAAIVHPSAPSWQGDSVRGETERGRERETERERHTHTHTHTGSPPTIPLAGTVICCMHASRDGQTRPGSRASPGDLWIYANAGSQSPEQPPSLNNALIRQETSAHMPLPTLPSAIDLSPFCSEIHLHNLSLTSLPSTTKPLRGLRSLCQRSLSNSA